MQAREAIAPVGDDVDDHFHVPGVQIVQHRTRLALENARIERERRLTRVPTGRREAGAEIDDRVEGDSLVAEFINDVQQKLLAC
jgi:hypothetical protein